MIVIIRCGRSPASGQTYTEVGKKAKKQTHYTLPLLADERVFRNQIGSLTQEKAAPNNAAGTSARVSAPVENLQNGE
jgi:hypothetical protein